ncbi:MAG: DUF2508 family protein [Clostridia bacterium]|nr:MAG: DUF2508 family protein [Clostridia bacterium]
MLTKSLWLEPWPAGRKSFDVASLFAPGGIYYFRGIIMRRSGRRSHDQVEANRQIIDMLEEARREIEWARNFFAQASDPELVDQAIYRVGAAEKQYARVLRLAREGRVRGIVRLK